MKKIRENNATTFIKEKSMFAIEKNLTYVELHCKIRKE